MYNLSFMEEIEKEMKTVKDRKDKYIQIKTKVLEVQERIKKNLEKARKIEDKNSKEYKKLITEAKKDQERHKNLYKLLMIEEKRFENVKQYIVNNLKINKAILEKYKDVKDNEELNKIKTVVETAGVKKDKLDEKLMEISEKLKLNKKTSEEIKQMSPEDRKEAIEAREQYLNNKKEFDKYQKIKYVSLLGDKEPKKRIEQCEAAIAYVEQNFNIENIEEITSKLEQILGTEKQRAKIKFDAKTHTYTYIDERGKEKIYNLFEKDENGKYKSILTETNINSTIQTAKLNGLNNRQIKKIDFNVVMVLSSNNPELVNNYFKSIKNGEQAKFDIEYDLRTKNIDKEEKISRKDLRKIKKSAMKQKAIGIANVIKDKSKLKIVGILSALGIAGGAAALAGNLDKLQLDSGKEVSQDIDETNKNVKETYKVEKDKNEEQDKTKQGETGQEKSKQEETFKEEIVKEDTIQKEATVGDYINIAEGAMLFSNPSDELRIMNGIGATEKIVIKQTAGDKLYRVNKEAYYSLNGEFIEINSEKDLEKALQEKGLDKSFIENEETSKMYHVVADGVAQWVSAEDVKIADLRVNDFEEAIIKKEEREKVDEAFENYYKQKSSIKQQAESKATTNNTKNEQKTEQKVEQIKNDTKQQEKTETKKNESKNSGEVIIDDSEGEVIIVDDSKGEVVTSDAKGDVIIVDDEIER